MRILPVVPFLAVAALAVGLVVAGPPARTTGTPRPAEAAAAPADTGPAHTGVIKGSVPDPAPKSGTNPLISAPSGAVRIAFAADGGGRYRAAPGVGPVIGAGRGPLMRYRVAVEREIAGVDPAALADFVARTYADPRGWSADGWRFQRVGPDRAADFTVYLVTPGTRARLCGSRDRYTSCRNGARVVLNVARWAHGVPGYGAPIETYRRYMVNHETGHRLGHGHARCPGAGRPAPVMAQQTLGLHGCRANPWPHLDRRTPPR